MSKKLIFVFWTFIFTGVFLGVNAKESTISELSKKFVGEWTGALKVNNIDLICDLKIKYYPKSMEFRGLISFPQQTAAGFKFKKITIQDNSLKFKVKKLGIQYEGLLNNETSEISGIFQQNGMEIDLTFKRGKTNVRPQEPNEPYSYVQEEVTFENKTDQVTLSGTLTLPNNSNKPSPTVILIPGSGPNDRNESVIYIAGSGCNSREIAVGHRPFLVLSDYLTRNGLAVLRFDKRGIGKSTGDYGLVTTEDFANDILAAIAYLKSRKEIDSQQIGLIGHSEGGIIAPMVALKSANIAFIVLMAAPAIGWQELTFKQREAIGIALGWSEEIIKLDIENHKRWISILKNEKDLKKAEEQLKWFAKYSLEFAGLKNITDEQLDNELKRINSPWFRYILNYDPSLALKQIKVPVLALNGMKDVQVLSQENLSAISKYLIEGGNNDFKIIEFPKLNHMFQTCNTGSVDEYLIIEETIALEVLKTISDWILERVKK